MENALKRQFDVYPSVRFGEFKLRFTAHYHRRDERYMLTKDVKVWGVENHQHFYVLEPEVLTKDCFYRFQAELDSHIAEQMNHSEEHMSSVFIGVILTNEPVPTPLMRRVRKAKKLSFLKWGLHGWAERYVVILSLREKELYSSKKARPFVEPIAQLLKN
ncbi:hypothetical protein [Shouchella shacheensis]|uniref:hypothetical protein n=1 Tax=Shouchella shacheensis TaxID=1649580 RepID=UPI00074024E3|nr:hypothetical protein [Shouchella shacheensis]